MKENGHILSEKMAKFAVNRSIIDGCVCVFVIYVKDIIIDSNSTKI